MPPIGTPGYHRVYVGERDVTLAVAPPRCVMLEDIAPGKRLWGVGVQLYALRRLGDDYASLLADVRRVVRAPVRAAKGHVVSARGDDVFAVFVEAPAALAWDEKQQRCRSVCALPLSRESGSAAEQY